MFLHFDESFNSFLQFLIKNTNYLVDYMVYASFLGKSLLLAFGNSFPDFRKIFTPAYLCTFVCLSSQNSIHITWYLLLDTCYLIIAICYNYLLSVTCNLLLANSYMLSVTCYMFLTICYLLSVTCYLLFVT